MTTNTQSSDNIGRGFDVGHTQSERVFASFHNWTKHEFNTTHRKPSSRHNNGFLHENWRQRRNRMVGLSAYKVVAIVIWNAHGVIHIDYLQKGKDSQWRLIFQLIGTFQQFEKKTTIFDQKTYSTKTIPGAHVCSRFGKIWIVLWIAPLFAIFSGFSPEWLFLVSKRQEIIPRKEIWC